jgi:hypothetical protein
LGVQIDQHIKIIATIKNLVCSWFLKLDATSGKALFVAKDTILKNIYGKYKYLCKFEDLEPGDMQYTNMLHENNLIAKKMFCDFGIMSFIGLDRKHQKIIDILMTFLPYTSS